MNKSFIFKCPLCNEIPEKEKDEFLQNVRFTIREYNKDEWIISQGEEYLFLNILIEGEIKTVMVDEKGDFMHIEVIKAPHPMATGFLFARNNKSPITAIAKTNCKLISIPKDNVFALMKKHDAFMHAILTSISNKLQFLSEKIRLTSLRTIKAKIAYFILQESKGETSFHLNTSKQEMADLFGVSRPALSNVIKQMEEEEVIRIQKRKVDILDRQELKAMF